MHRALGLDYQLLPVPPQRAAATLRALPGSGFAGVNVTIPHKSVALEVATSASERARAIGAANTLVYGDDGAIHADNTDATGFLASIQSRPQATALVLGAGGSARAIVWALVSVGCDVVVWNRTAERARQLTAELGGRVLDPDAEAPAADLLVNCTSAELSRSSRDATIVRFDVDHLARYATVVDLAYKPGGTLLTAEAAKCTVVVDGLEILVQQGARSFALWTGRTADLAVMREAVAGEHTDGPPDFPPAGPLPDTYGR